MDSVEAGWYNSCTQPYDPSTRCALMFVAPARDWHVFQQIFAEHWDEFTHAHPRYQTSYYEGLVAQMLRCGDPDQMGSVAYRCLHCGQGTHRVAMRCQSSLCLRCAKVYVDNWIAGATAAIGWFFQENSAKNARLCQHSDAELERKRQLREAELSRAQEIFNEISNTMD